MVDVLSCFNIECSGDDSKCEIEITHNDLGTGDHYAKYNAWKMGDKRLDWAGSEDGQGDYNGEKAEGTPTVWTTNDKQNAAYQELNM